MARYFRQSDPQDMTPTELRIACPEVHHTEPEPRWSWDGDSPTPFAIGAVVVGLVFSTVGLAVLVFALVSELAR